MNLIAALLILTCLIGSEVVGATAADDLVVRILAVAITAALVPALAFFQTSALIYKIRNANYSQETKHSLCRRMTTSHALAWLSASTAIIWALRWQDIVRGNWHLDRWPLVDEALILAPALISMLASWAIFYELQLAITGPRRSEHPDDAPSIGATPNLFSRILNRCSNTVSQLRPRFEFVSIRFRVYFMLVLIPVGVFVLLRDAANYASSLPEPLGVTLLIGGLTAMMIGFPFIMLLIWNNGPIEDPDLRDEIMATCRRHRLNVSRVRTWQTGSQVINAAVAGWFPRLRIIFLSDGLLQQFAPAEILAVLRHEAGHIRLWHIPTRVMFLLLPPAVWLAQCCPGFINPQLNDRSFLLEPSTWLPLLWIVAYTMVVVRWLSHRMEHEADLYAIQVDPDESKSEPKTESPCEPRRQMAGDSHAIFPQRVEAMKAALLRLAAFSPGEFDRTTLLHPSLRSRVRFLEKVEQSPQCAGRFRTSFARQRWALAVVLGISIVWIQLL